MIVFPEKCPACGHDTARIDSVSHSFACMKCGHLTQLRSQEPVCCVDGCEGKATSGGNDKRYCSEHMLVGLSEFVRKNFKNVRLPE